MLWAYLPAGIRDRATFGLKLVVVLYMNMLLALLLGALGEYLTGWHSLLWGGLPYIGLCLLTLSSSGARERLRL